MRWFRYAFLALVVNCAAADTQVVAFDAGAVLGWGVAPADSYPAQLEAMLQAKGMNVTVIIAGVDPSLSDAGALPDLRVGMTLA